MQHERYEEDLTNLTKSGTTEDIEHALKDMLWTGLGLYAGMGYRSEFWPHFVEALGHVALWVHESHPSLSVEDRLMRDAAGRTLPLDFLPHVEGQVRASMGNWLMAAYRELQGLMQESRVLEPAIGEGSQAT
jgi:hypothetical protein